MEKGVRIFKAILYILSAVVILVFHEEVMPYVGILVGGVVAAWSLDELIVLLREKNFAALSIPVVQIVISMLLFLAHGDIVKICIIWGVWSVIRESREMTGALVRVLQRRSGVLNITESVVVIVLSAMMILEPSEHHAHVHVILLAVELILEIVFPLSNRLLDRRAEHKKAARQAQIQTKNAGQ